MWDESDENKKVSCPFCDSEENCPHLLAVSDGSSLVGGFAYNHEDSFYSRVYDAFQKTVGRGRYRSGVVFVRTGLALGVDQRGETGCI